MDFQKQSISDLVNNVKEYAVAKAILVKVAPSTSNNSRYSLCPFTLHPSPFSASLYKYALEIQVDFNLLIQSAANDKHLLRNSLVGAIEHDPFISRLYSIYKGIKNNSVTLDILRCDYVIDPESHCLRQIEINTIASSLMGLADKVVDVHKYALSMLGMNGSIPDNNALTGIAKGFNAAMRYYNKLYETTAKTVLMVIRPFEQNTIDQRALELELFEQYGIFTKRCTLAEVVGGCTIGDDRRLYWDNEEMFIVYYRSGYNYCEYSEIEWKAREFLEFSLAVKSPSIASQLLGTKLMQEVFSQPVMLENLLGQDRVAECDRMRNTFCRLWNLNNFDEDLAQLVASNSEKFVLKPQREGGTNNMYDSDIVDMFQNHPNSLPAYTLMERIYPEPHLNYLMDDKEVADEVQVVSELGVYGVILYHGSEVFFNDGFGWLLRSKTHLEKNCSVASGTAVLDTPLLI